MSGGLTLMPRSSVPGSLTRRHTNEQLKHEKSTLGFYISSHPLDQYRQTIDRFSSVAIRDIHRLPAEATVVIGGIVTRVRPTLVRNGRSKGQKMAMITIEDLTGHIDAVVFSDAYAPAEQLLQTDRMIMIKGRVDRRLGWRRRAHWSSAAHSIHCTPPTNAPP